MRHFKKSDGLLRKGIEVKCVFIDEHRKDHPVDLLCRVLEISRNAYYSWKSHVVTQREERDQILSGDIQASHKRSRQTYGSRRIHADLRAKNVSCSRRRVRRIMDSLEIEAVRPRRRVHTTNSKHSYPIAENLLDRNFSPVATPLNYRWASDITYISVGSSWTYLAVILDLTSRRVIGWAISDNIDRFLILDALRMAVSIRKILPDMVIFHSDRGSQYASTEFRRVLEESGLTCSMSGKGDCYDNAVIESFNGTIKRELIDRVQWTSSDEVTRAVGEYIECWYNRYRLHSSLGYVSPVQFELQEELKRPSLPAKPRPRSAQE